MSHPISPDDVANGAKIRLHSAIAKPLAYVVTGIYTLGHCATTISAFRGEAGVHPAAVLAIAVPFGLMIVRMWSLCQRVYMTTDGIELTRPPRLVPWAKIGDTFRYPLLGSLPPTCCIGINDAENWDLHFFGRRDFETVVARFRAANTSTTHSAGSTRRARGRTQSPPVLDARPFHP